MTDWLTEIYTALGGASGRYLGYSYGLSETNALETLLQTPTLWGHDPTELNYVPAATNLIDDIKDLIGTAQETVDIAFLAPLPNGYFLEAIRGGLQQAAKLHPHVIVRILDGIPIAHPGGSFEEFMEQLNPPSTL